jgi:DNA replication and repair protein RecF
MRLDHIKLENFRNHLDFETDLGQTTAIIGRNGRGKSNILEAITILSACRSFREEDKRNLVNYDSAYARVTGDSLEVFIQKDPNLLFRAKEKGLVRKQSDYVGLLKSVIFSPESILIVSGSPRLRRRFIDIMISQEDQYYLKNLIQFEKIRKERNSLLTAICERRATEDQLDFWDKEFVEKGESIIAKRLSAIDFLNSKISALYKQISGKDADELMINYENSCGEESLERKMINMRQREIWAKRSLCGPHRDDISFYLNKKEAASFASRGETRSVMLALKIAELNYLEAECEDKPILLLDDLFSEFDADRRGHLSRLVADYQTVMTTTDKKQFPKELIEISTFIEL